MFTVFFLRLSTLHPLCLIHTGKETSTPEKETLRLCYSQTMMTSAYPLCVVSDNAVTGQKRKLYEVVIEPKKVRKSPFATKICDRCKVSHYVPSAQKMCIVESCNCNLKLVEKEDKVLKRAPPLCSKFCVVCDTMIEDIPTATKLCQECNNPLEKLNKKPKVIRCMLVEKK